MPKSTSDKSSGKRALHRMIWQFMRSSVFFWVPAVIFLVLANNVYDNEPLPGDVAILTFLYGLTSDTLNQFFLIVTALGSTPIVTAGVAIAVAAMWYLHHRRKALFLIFAAGGTATINILFKLFFERTRPDLWQTLILEESYSFPSGHAMISSALSLAVVILAWRTKYRWYAVGFGAVYTLLVGVSRLYLGVHFPSDILGGWCISILWILTMHHVLQRFANRRSIDMA